MIQDLQDAISVTSVAKVFQAKKRRIGIDEGMW